jgi:ketosteroid isomerase-like protein
MSEENVEIARLAHERLNEGDIDGLVALCDRDFELDMSARAMNPGTYRGHEGIRRFYREVSEVWEEMRWEPLRFAAAADKVVVVMHDHGRGRGSGLEVTRRGTAWVWTIREELAVSVHFYADQAKALEAAGLSG